MRQVSVLAELRHSEAVTLDELTRRCAGGRRQVTTTIVRLIRRGLAEREAHGRYRLTAAGAEAVAKGLRIRSGPRQPWLHVRRQVKRTTRQQVWTALRWLGKACVPELQAVVGDDAKPANVRKYLTLLERAGYVIRLAAREPGTARTSNGHVRWSLVRDTGPKAPVWRPRLDVVHDPNDGSVHRLWADRAG